MGLRQTVLMDKKFRKCFIGAQVPKGILTMRSTKEDKVNGKFSSAENEDGAKPDEQEEKDGIFSFHSLVGKPLDDALITLEDAGITKQLEDEAKKTLAAGKNPAYIEKTLRLRKKAAEFIKGLQNDPEYSQGTFYLKPCAG